MNDAGFWYFINNDDSATMFLKFLNVSVETETKEDEPTHGSVGFSSTSRKFIYLLFVFVLRVLIDLHVIIVFVCGIPLCNMVDCILFLFLCKGQETEAYQMTTKKTVPVTQIVKSTEISTSISETATAVFKRPLNDLSCIGCADYNWENGIFDAEECNDREFINEL